jgi:hypothetical protein
VGDCSSDFRVLVDEVLRCVTMAIAIGGAATCPGCDGNMDGMVTVDEIVRAVNAALNGCP